MHVKKSEHCPLLVLSGDRRKSATVAFFLSLRCPLFSTTLDFCPYAVCNFATASYILTKTACSGNPAVTFTISHLNQNVIKICDNFENLQGLFSSLSIFSSIVVAAFISRGRRVTNLMRSMAPHQTQSAEKHKFIPRRSRVTHSHKVME